MSWYVIIPLQILAIYVCNKIISKYLDKPYEKEYKKFYETWHRKNSKSYLDYTPDEEVLREKQENRLKETETLNTSLHWFSSLTIIILPIIIFGNLVNSDNEGWIGILIIVWLTSLLMMIVALQLYSKRFDKNFDIFLKICGIWSIFCLGFFWLLAMGLELDFINNLLDSDLGFVLTLIGLIISFFGFPFWLYEKATKDYYSNEKSLLSIWSKIDLGGRKAITWIIIGFIYLPIISYMFKISTM